MWSFEVPNAPCGVESNNIDSNFAVDSCPVPNAPCGVERLCKHAPHLQNLPVPNAPCGVESVMKWILY